MLKHLQEGEIAHVPRHFMQIKIKCMLETKNCKYNFDIAPPVPVFTYRRVASTNVRY